MQSTKTVRPGAGQPVTGHISTSLSGGLLGGALRMAESVLLRGGQQTARRNAWDAVCENRRHAQDREDVRRVLVHAAR